MDIGGVAIRASRNTAVNVFDEMNLFLKPAPLPARAHFIHASLLISGVLQKIVLRVVASNRCTLSVGDL
jgi:hypothetical protein